jgi:hypothetical protein
VNTIKIPWETTDFSLVLGGPLYQLFRRAHLGGDTVHQLCGRIVVMSLFAWLPLLVLSAVDGQLLAGSSAMPFLLDAEVNIRFLVAMPLLIGAELVVNRRLRVVRGQFLSRNLIPEDAKPKFEAAAASLFRWRNSMFAELVLIALVYGVGVLVIWRLYAVIHTSSWYTAPVIGRQGLSPAGMWYAYVSVPLFQFLLLRWYFRLFIWGRFLWQISRIELSLVPTHPDRLGGLGFLALTAYAFVPLAMAHGVTLSGMIANRIIHVGTALTAFKAEIAVVVVFVQCLVFVPLLFFASQLARTKRTGRSEYGTLAERYVREFDTKWLRGGAPSVESLMGSADIQSLADLGNSFEVIGAMRITPVTKEAILLVAAATLLPVTPLLLTMMPLEEMLKQLLGILL